jgi:hypothetical protein
MNVNIGCHSFAGDREREREKKGKRERVEKFFGFKKNAKILL